jgi:late competence protein required for DNA uptake (superfamily II DNA/RNA helicase)
MAKNPSHEQDTPSEKVVQTQRRRIECPHCDSTETELFSHFGSMLLSAQYYCRNCRTVFDWVRWDRP